MELDVDPNEEESRTTRKIRKSGNSVVVTLPPALLREAGFLVGDDVEVAASFEGGSIELRDLDEEVAADTVPVKN